MGAGPGVMEIGRLTRPIQFYSSKHSRLRAYRSQLRECANPLWNQRGGVCVAST